MTPLAEDLGFRAVAALSSHAASQPGKGDHWKLRRDLFDRGLVGIGSVQGGNLSSQCFLASDAIRNANRLDAGSRGQITISSLGRNGRFANQLFQYAFVKLYALRHGLSAAVPDWQGRDLFDLRDAFSAGITLPRLEFAAFKDSDRRLWEVRDPPIDIDVLGYFQEIPECWRPHRSLLRSMFALPVERQDSLDAWRDDLTIGGQRTLVAAHVRRTDYRDSDLPYFRIVPDAWYLSWLRTIWPTLREPLLFVATDEPDQVLSIFEEFAPISTLDWPATQLPEHVRDFEVLRRADYLAICNSSFSRMAAILAPANQRCFLPSFPEQRLVPYEPWIDPGFWARFADPSPDSEDHERTARGDEDAEFQTRPATYFDVTDLLLYLLDHPTLSGIQRVQCEIVRNLPALPEVDPVHFAIVKDGGLATIEPASLLNTLDRFRSDPAFGVRSNVRALFESASPCIARPGDVFVATGAFWAVGGMGKLVQELKNSGVAIGLFVHDIIPISHPEYFHRRAVKIFVKAAVEVLGLADFILTSSNYNKTSLAKYRSARGLKTIPIDVVPLAHELSRPVNPASEIGDVIAGLAETEFVLCVGTIEVRKNPAYLLNIWKLMVQSGRANIPTLVFAGRNGWLVRDFIEQLKACDYLDGRIALLHDVTDPELDVLYRRCLLTMSPSFDEGWGLPVGESLAYGKVCIASAVGGIPEVGGRFVDYVDPYNAYSGLEQLLRYLDDPKLRRRRETTIARHFELRSWQQFAGDVFRSARTLVQERPRFEGIAAITLPPNRFLAISNSAETIAGDAMDGALSAEVACISGWQPPEIDGVWADEPVSILRFRAAAAVGSNIHLILRLATASENDLHLRIVSGSGAQTFVSLAGETGKVAILPCEVEPGNLVTACFSLALASDEHLADPPYWKLKGFLCIQPDLLVAETVEEPLAKAAPVAAELLASAPPPPQRKHPTPPNDRIEVAATQLDKDHCALSFDAFLRSTDSYWPAASGSSTYRDAPIFAERADRDLFYTRHRNANIARVGDVADRITVHRRSNQFVSMSRFSEGAVFDEGGISRELGYVLSAPPDTPWLRRDADGLRICDRSLAAAPYYDGSYLVFYNGNLHNYYHWLAEGILSLDTLTQALDSYSGLNIALPKSIDINAVFDHRAMLRALGFDDIPTVEIAAGLIKVREAIWIENGDFIEEVPPSYLRNFQQRTAAKYAPIRGPRNRRLLIERKGPTRVIRNFGRLQAFLSERGFETVSLEGMGIEEQILLFQQAEFVVGAHGAGLTNLLFCEPGTKVIEFMPSAEMRPFFWIISEKLNLVHAMQFCAGVGGEGFQASLDVDIDKLQALYRMIEAHR